MFNIISNHACNFLKVDLITTTLYILHLIQEPFYVFLVKIADEFPEKHPEILEADLFLLIVEQLE